MGKNEKKRVKWLDTEQNNEEMLKPRQRLERRISQAPIRLPPLGPARLISRRESLNPVLLRRRASRRESLDFRRRKTIGVIIRRGLKRFKKAVRMVIVLLRSGGILDTHKREFIDPVDLVYREFSTSLSPDKKILDDDLFNPRYYRHSTYLNMLKSVQSFLQLNPISRKRNPAMLDTTMRALQIFKVFNTYPYEVQRELAATAYLEIFSPGKIIIKEEGLPERYYMVLCGQGLRAKSLRLPAGNVQLKIHGVISEGDDFGNENGILMANLNDEYSRYNIVQRRKECVFSKTYHY